MPPTNEMMQKAMECLSKVKLVKFTADRTTIIPGHTETMLNWEVTVPRECRIKIVLNNETVAKKAGKKVAPLSNTTYRLEALIYSLRKTLGTIHINVDTSSCSIKEIPESVIATLVKQEVNANIIKFSSYKVKKRRETQVEVEPSGIIVRIRLKADIPNFPDPDLDVDAKIAIGLTSDRKVWVTYKSFAVDIDFPWYVHVGTVGLSFIAEKIVEDLIENKIKKSLLEEVKKKLDSSISQSNGTIAAIITKQDKVVITIC